MNASANSGANFVVNARSLFIAQLVSYALPLLLIPYLTRVLGIELYGVVALGIAFSQICSVLVDYGFNLSATYEISVYRESKAKIEAIYASVLGCKVILLAVTILASAMFLFGTSVFEKHRMFLFAMLFSVAGQACQPQWLLQGLERMGVVTLYTLCSRITYCAAVFVVIRTPEDLYWIPVANGAGHVLAAVIGICAIYRMGYRLHTPALEQIKDSFRSSTPFFFSRAALATYTSGAVLVLGAFANSVEVAKYSVAEQLYRGAQSLFAPIPQALYPSMAKDGNYRLFFRVMKFVIVLGVIGGASGFLVGEWVLLNIFGSEYVESFNVLTVFIITMFITMPSALLGYPLLGALGKLEIANRSILIGGLVQTLLLCVICAIGPVTALWVACCVLMTEVTVLAYRYRFVSRAFPQKFRFF